MSYKNYGEAFKEIRTHKGMSLSELEYISGVSKSTLSQFENGNQMLSFDKLDRALEAMYVTLLDYSFVINHGKTEYFIAQFNEIEECFLNKRFKRLSEIYQINIRNNEKGTNLIALCAKVCFSPLDKDEVEIIENYFTSGIEWSLYDIRVLLHVLGQIKLELLTQVLKEFFSTNIFGQYIDELATYRKPVIWILIRCALIFMAHNRQAEVELMIEKLEHFAKRSDFTAKIGLYFVKSCDRYLFISKEEGLQSFEKLFYILEEIDAQEVKKLMMLYFKKKIQNLREN